MHRSYLWRLVLPVILWIGSLQLTWAQQPAPQGPLREVQRPTTETAADSARRVADSLRRADDRAYLDSLRRTSQVQAPIRYQARDSLVLDLRAERVRLYGKAQMDFETRQLSSERMTVDQTTNTITSVGIPDTADPYGVIGRPVFKEGQQTYDTDTIRYNFVTKRGSIIYTRTQQGENILQASRIRREPEGFFYASGSRFTTCTDPDHPHYFIASNRIKYIPNDKIVTGPFYLVVGDIPLPLIFPFGFFPNRIGRHSGILFPVFGEDANRGFNLRNGGFYFAPSQFVDITVRGDIYTNTSWRAELGSRYIARYRLQGQLLLQYAVNRLNTPTDPDFSENRDFRINWNHTQTITPNMQFTASVNAGSTQFDRRATNAIQNVFNNTLASSINFNHTLPISGWNYSINANHSQNTQTRVIDLNFPSVTLTRTQPIQPFANLAPGGLPTWYSSINLNYTAQAENRVSISERNFGRPEMFDSLQSGLAQRLSMGTNLKLLRVITLAPGINYTEYWYPRTTAYQTFAEPAVERLRLAVPGNDTVFTQVVNGTRYGVIGTRQDGFAAARDFGLGVTANTRIYGVYRTRWRNQAAFRHSIIPTVGFAWRPDFSTPDWGFYQTLNVVPGQAPRTFNRFVGGVVGSPGGGNSSLINFSLQNLLEMRYLPSDSTRKTIVSKKDYKYLNILDDVSLSGSWNLAADSFKLSRLNLTARTNLLNNLVNIQFTSQLEPYQEDTLGRVRRLRLEQFRPFQPASWNFVRFVSTSLNVGLNLSSAQGKGRSRRDVPEAGASTDAPIIGSEQQPEVSPVDAYRASYADFQLPWNLSINYTITIGNRSPAEIFQDQLRGINRRRDISQTLNFSGSFQLGANWRFTLSSGWDFNRQELVLTPISIIRDLHCWEFSFNAVPFGFYRSYNFQINVKTGNLRDLRIQKRRDWRDNPTVFR